MSTAGAGVGGDAIAIAVSAIGAFVSLAVTPTAAIVVAGAAPTADNELDVGRVMHIPGEAGNVLGEQVRVLGDPEQELHGLLGGGCALHAAAHRVEGGVLLLDGRLEGRQQRQALV